MRNSRCLRAGLDVCELYLMWRVCTMYELSFGMYAILQKKQTCVASAFSIGAFRSYGEGENRLLKVFNLNNLSRFLLFFIIACYRLSDRSIDETVNASTVVNVGVRF